VGVKNSFLKGQQKKKGNPKTETQQEKRGKLHLGKREKIQQGEQSRDMERKKKNKKETFTQHRKNQPPRSNKGGGESHNT